MGTSRLWGRRGLQPQGGPQVQGARSPQSTRLQVTARVLWGGLGGKFTSILRASAWPRELLVRSLARSEDADVVATRRHALWRQQGWVVC